MLSADDAALASHTQEGLQSLVNCLAHACREFGLTNSLKKTNAMGQDVSEAPSISIRDYTLEVVEDFTDLGSFISSNLSLEAEMNRHIGKAASTMSRLSKLSKRSMHWLSYVRRMEVGCLPEDVLYGELTSDSHPFGRPMLRYKDVYKRDMKSAEINPDSWEAAAADRSNWHHMVRTGVRGAVATRNEQWHDKRERQRARAD